MKATDLVLFGPPLLIVLGAWITMMVVTRDSRARARLVRRQGPAE